MKIKDCIKWATGYLSESKIEYPQRYVEILLSDTTGLNKIKFYLYPDLEIDTDKFNLFKSMVERKVNSEPVQYITGWTEFFGFKFHVKEGVFIPRPETEILVEEIIRDTSQNRMCPYILDIGTGSGNIAISLSKMFPYSFINATDVSQISLDIAKYNARINDVEDRITFLESSIFNDGIKEKFDIVVSNPPYIKKSEINNLPKEVKDYEPGLALDGGNDGLDFYRVIIKNTKYYLKNDGILALECGINQSEKIVEMIFESGFLILNRVVKDLNGIDRVVIAKREIASWLQSDRNDILK